MFEQFISTHFLEKLFCITITPQNSPKTPLKNNLKFVTIEPMKTLYDVQQFLKQFGIIVYMGKRLYDIELMRIELKRIYDAGLMDRLVYFEAEAVLRREYKIEQEREKKE